MVPRAFAIFQSLLRALADHFVPQPGDLNERVAQLLALLLPEQRTEFRPVMAVLLSNPDADPAALGETRQEQQRALARAVRSLLLAATARRSLIWICEDLHQADDASLDLLEQLIALGGMNRLLLCTMSRPTGSYDAAMRSVRRVIATARNTYGDAVELLTLEGLDAQAGGALLDRLLPGLTPPARDALLAHTGGNPLFLELLVPALLRQGDLRPGAQGFVLRADGERLNAPGSLRELVMEQVDQLPPEVRRLGQAAAVIAAAGRDVASWLLEQISDDPPAVVAARLAELERARFLERLHHPRERRYRFRHALFQQVAYSRLLESRRVELHRRAGRALHARSDPHSPRAIAALAYHSYEGQDWELALPYALTAGRRAGTIYANREARRHLRRVLGLARLLDRPVQQPQIHPPVACHPASADTLASIREVRPAAARTHSPPPAETPPRSAPHRSASNRAAIHSRHCFPAPA
ncbi:MAG: hypothetical protein HC822_22125, partial [Oscillochloris sp.]|nr:hypothetical protein [Oscillochloris sp.]